MSWRNRIRGDERGSVLVMTALWLPVVILMASFVIDAGNWFEHKRHLQLQADAGAFAAGSLFNGCFGDQTAANTSIDSEARKYSGDPTGVAPYNLQIGGSNQGAVTVRINKKMFQVGGPGPDDTVEDLPCAAKMVDVKITEAGLPWFVGGGSSRRSTLAREWRFSRRARAPTRFPSVCRTAIRSPPQRSSSTRATPTPFSRPRS